jgi:hypothetical protein
MIRIVLSLAALGLLASCSQYREPQANCFSFMATTSTGGPAGTTAPDCTFAPLGVPEGAIDV